MQPATTYESEWRTFESFRARHFGTELGTPKPAVFAPEAATSVRSSSLFDPMMRSLARQLRPVGRAREGNRGGNRPIPSACACGPFWRKSGVVESSPRDRPWQYQRE